MKSTEEILVEKYEEEFSKYCFDALGITNGEGYIHRLEDGETFWNWLEEHHYDEWKALMDEDNRRMQMRVRSAEEEKELDEIDRQMAGASSIVYDPPMSQTEEYLLKQQREEEYRSNDY